MFKLGFVNKLKSFSKLDNDFFLFHLSIIVAIFFDAYQEYTDPIDLIDCIFFR